MGSHGLYQVMVRFYDPPVEGHGKITIPQNTRSPAASFDPRLLETSQELPPNRFKKHGKKHVWMCCSNIFCVTWSEHPLKHLASIPLKFKETTPEQKKVDFGREVSIFGGKKVILPLICTSFLLPDFRFWSSSHTGSQAGILTVGGATKKCWVALRQVCVDPWRDVYLIPDAWQIHGKNTRKLSRYPGGLPEKFIREVDKEIYIKKNVGCLQGLNLGWSSIGVTSPWN